jgi:hypothetical protein
MGVTNMRSLINLLIILAIGSLSVTPLSAGAQSSTEPPNQSSLTIDRSSLNGSAMMLRVVAPQGANLTGTVKINGKVIANLKNARSISLQKCLAFSTCQIDLAAKYNPSSSIEVKIYSTNGAVSSSLQSDGTGDMQQRFSLQLN